MRDPFAALAIAPAALAASLAVAGIVACHRGKPEPDETPAAARDAGATAAGSGGGAAVAVAAPPPGPTGAIAGRIILKGTPPQMPLLQRGSDPFCGKKEMHAEAVVVGAGGGLANALVRISPGTVPSWVPSTPVVVDQVDCMYRPRVQGGVRGQSLVIKNSDPVAHNVEARRLPWGERRDLETLFNRGQPAGSRPLEGRIRDADVHKLKCHMHGWMQAYVVVGDNPYFATTDAEGRFTIDRAPVGSYELQIWHEFYGVKTARVSVEEGKTAAVDLSYDAERDRPASAGGGSGPG